MGGRDVGEEDDGGGSLKEDPSNWRSRIFPEHRETLPRLPGPGETCSPVLQGRRTSSLRNSGNGVRLGVEGRGRRILFLLRSRPPVVSTTARGGTDVSGREEEEEEVRFCRCTPTDSRTTFIACRIYGVFALATETRGKYKFVPRSAEISRLGRDLFLATIFSLPSFLLELTIGLIFLVHGVFTHSRFTVV